MVIAKSAKSRSQITRDFDKQKAKLGKGKKVTNNATNTSFKSRSIALPQQSIGRDRQDVLVTRRKLNLEDLLSQLRHPTGHVRKDAIDGLFELLQKERSTKVLLPSKIIANVVKLLSDNEAIVRQSLLQFWTAYISKISAKRLMPYTSIIVLHITSSMSHIFPDIRIDAIKFLDLSLRAIGKSMVIGWENFAHRTSNVGQSQKGDQSFGARLLQCYFSILGIPLDSLAQVTGDGMDKHAFSNANASILSTDLSNHALLVILSSLDRFLSLALERHPADRTTNLLNLPPDFAKDIKEESDLEAYPSWMIVSNLRDEAERFSFLQTLSLSAQKVGMTRNEKSLCEIEIVSTHEDDFNEKNNVRELFQTVAQSFDVVEGLGSFGTDVSGYYESKTSLSLSKDIEARQKLFCSLFSLLQTCFLDAVPSIYDPHLGSSTLEKDRGKNVSFRIVNLVVSISLNLWRGLHHAGDRSRSWLSKLVNRIAPHFPFGSAETREVQEAWIDTNLSFCELHGLLSSSLSGKGFQTESHSDNIYNYIIHLLSSESTTIYGSRFVAILPTIWSLLAKGDDERSENLIFLLVDQWNLIPLNDHATRRLSTRFLGHLLLLPTFSSYQGHFSILRHRSCRSKLIQWLCISLPQRLWELNAKNPMESDEILELLRQVSVTYNHSPEKSLRQSEIKSLLRPFQTFFCTEHAKYGEIDGPYSRLPSHVQKRAMGVLHSLPFDQELFSAAQSVTRV